MLPVLVILFCLTHVVVAGRVPDQFTPTSLGAAELSDGAALPVVLWHGMGDSCCSMGSIGSVAKLIEDELGVFVYSIATGAGEYKDIWSSFYGNVNAQVAEVCRQLGDLQELRGGFNMVGMSQGGQFLRAVVQRCGHQLPPIHSLITLGGQHQGVSNTPGCSTDLTGVAATACSAMQVLLGRGAYAPWVRENLVQAQYFKDPNNLEAYLYSNIFLPDINNEREDKDSSYADNLASLTRLVLYRFEEDTTVVPRDSAWFSFWDGKEVVSVFDQDIFKQDWIGLRRLHEAGGLLLETAPGEHMQFSIKWFKQEIIAKYLADSTPQK